MSAREEAEAIFDAFEKLARVEGLLRQRAECEGDIRRASNVCGSCALWMTRECPREQLLPTGRHKGPSMNSPKCGSFVMSQWASDFAARRTAEMAEIDAKIEERP